MISRKKLLAVLSDTHALLVLPVAVSDLCWVRLRIGKVWEEWDKDAEHLWPVLSSSGTESSLHSRRTITGSCSLWRLLVCSSRSCTGDLWVQFPAPFSGSHCWWGWFCLVRSSAFSLQGHFSFPLATVWFSHNLSTSNLFSRVKQQSLCPPNSWVICKFWLQLTGEKVPPSVLPPQAERRQSAAQEQCSLAPTSSLHSILHARVNSLFALTVAWKWEPWAALSFHGFPVSQHSQHT